MQVDIGHFQKQGSVWSSMPGLSRKRGQGRMKPQRYAPRYPCVKLHVVNDVCMGPNPTSQHLEAFLFGGVSRAKDAN